MLPALKFHLSYALLAEPKSSIFSLTVALIASTPGARSFLGSKPLPWRSLPASMYLRVAAAKASWHSVLTLILETPREIEASTKSNRGQARCDISLRLFNDSDSIGAEIELKYFKYDKTQEAVTDNRFSVLMDLENLELYKKREPRLMCYEFVYTDNKNYANPSTTSGIKLAPCITQSYTYGGKTINLNACYEAEWTAYGEHYFMKTRI